MLVAIVQDEGDGVAERMKCDVEDELSPEEHDEELGDPSRCEEYPVAQQQRGHGRIRGEDSVQRSLFLFLENRSGGTGH